jgi:hypothetical protein
MTTAAFRRPRVRAGAAACAGVLALWLLALAARPSAGLLVIPAAVVVAARVLSRGVTEPWFTRLAVVMGTLAAAAGGGLVAREQPVAVFVPALAALAYLAVRRWPMRALVFGFALSSIYGSLEAFTTVSAGPLVDLVLIGLWLTFLVPLALAQRSRELRLTPGMLLLIAYVVVTLGGLVVASDVNFAARDFRLSIWHVMAAIPITYIAWRPVTLDRAAKLFGVVALLGGAYATLRWAIGPSGKESALLQGGAGVLYNQVEVGEDKVQGAFPNGQELGLWASLMVPFLVASTLSWRGPWKVVAGCGVPLVAVGLLGSGQRSGLVAAIAGAAVVLVVNQLSRGFRGPRLGAVGLAVVALVAAGTVVFPTVVDSPTKQQRYENILTPQRDGPFQERLFKWRNAFADLRGHPLGRGIGQAGAGVDQQRFSGNASDNVDNSYVKIAYEQGAAVMVLFAVALIALLIELVRHAVWTRAPGGAAHAMAGAGVLTAIILQFAGNRHIEALALLAGLMVVAFGLVQVVSPPPEPS